MNYMDKFSGKNVNAKRVSDVIPLTNTEMRRCRVRFDDGTHSDMDYNSSFISSMTQSEPIAAGCWYVDGAGYMTDAAFSVRYAQAPAPVFKASKSHRYVSHKEVEAYEIARYLPMHPTGYEVHFVGGQSRIVKNEVFQRYQPTTGDFLIIYRDGYISVSPRSEFLDGYSAKPEPVETADPIGKAHNAEKMLLDLMPSNRWGSIAKTELERAFMCVRRALYNA